MYKESAGPPREAQEAEEGGRVGMNQGSGRLLWGPAEGGAWGLCGQQPRLGSKRDLSQVIGGKILEHQGAQSLKQWIPDGTEKYKEERKTHPEFCFWLNSQLLKWWWATPPFLSFS